INQADVANVVEIDQKPPDDGDVDKLSQIEGGAAPFGVDTGEVIDVSRIDTSKIATEGNQKLVGIEHAIIVGFDVKRSAREAGEDSAVGRDLDEGELGEDVGIGEEGAGVFEHGE